MLYKDSSAYANITGVSIVDENDRVVNVHVGKKVTPGLIGGEASEFSTYNETKNNLPRPTFSTSFKSPVDGSQQFVLSYPIYKYETREYRGSLSAVIDAHSFLSKYGNLDNVNSQYVGFLDRNWTVIASPFKDAIGRNFYDPILAQASNEQADAHFEKVLSGQSNVALFEVQNGRQTKCWRAYHSRWRPHILLVYCHSD